MLKQGRGREAVETAFDGARLAPGGAAPAHFLSVYRGFAGDRRVLIPLLVVLALASVVLGPAGGGGVLAVVLVGRLVVAAAMALVGLWRTRQLPAEVRAALRAEGRLPLQRAGRVAGFVARGLVLLLALGILTVLLSGDRAGRPATALGWAAWAAILAAAGWVVVRWWRGGGG